MPILEEIVLALLFVFTSGIVANERFRKNKVLVGITGLLALIGSYFLIVQMTDRLIDHRLQEKEQAQKAPPVMKDDKSFELAYWQSVSTSNDVGLLQEYLKKYPNGEFAAVARDKIAALNAAARRPAAMPPTEDKSVEVAFWQSISGSGDAALFKAYLSRFPNGEFADLARARIAALSKHASVKSQRKPAEPGPSRTHNDPVPGQANNADVRNTGSLQLLGSHVDTTGRPCRTFQETYTKAGGVPISDTYTMCKDADGKWTTVNNQ